MWRPPFDDELRGRGVEPGDHDLGDVRDEHLAIGSAAGEDGASGDLRLARPLALLALFGVKGRAVDRETWVSLDSRSSVRSVCSVRRDRFVPSGIEQLLHSPSEVRLGLPDLVPGGHCTRAYPGLGALPSEE